jgi:hypothetical protein
MAAIPKIGKRAFKHHRNLGSVHVLDISNGKYWLDKKGIHSSWMM